MSTKNPTDAQGWLDQYLDRVRRSKQRTTHVAYSHQLRTLFRWLGEPDDWATVTTTDLEGFLERPRRTPTGRPSEAGLNRDKRILTSLFRHLIEEEVITKNPMRRLILPEGEHSEPRTPLPDDIWLAIWGADTTTTGDRLWLGLGYYCGLRRQEMATITPGDVRARDAQFDPGTLTFFRKGGAKRAGIAYAAIIETLLTRGLARLAPDGDAWIDLLEWSARYRHNRPFLLEGSTGNTDADCRRLYDRFRTLQRRVGVDEGELLTLHSLRHSAATNLVDCGVPTDIVRRQLSHSSDEVTARYVTTAKELGRWLDRERRTTSHLKAVDD